MSKTISIKLTQVGPTAGPFSIFDQFGNVIAEGVSKKTLLSGISYIVNDNVTIITIKSTGKCTAEKSVSVKDITVNEYVNIKVIQTVTGCTWRHLLNIDVYNKFYGNIEPYIIEYPLSYQNQDELLQNVVDYTKAYEYYPIPDGVFNLSLIHI